MLTFFTYVLYFFFYSAVGWLFESTYCSIGEKKLINRGFLFGPMCPIYGTGALVMAVLLYNPFRDKPLAVFFLGMLFCDIVEYITSVLMEKLFNARWWDYKNELFNINGRICFKHTLYWGIAAIFFVKTVHPIVLRLFAQIPQNYIIPIAVAVLAVFIVDVVFSAIKAVGFIKLRNKMTELKKLITENASEAKSQLGDAYSAIKAAMEEKYDNLVYTIGDKYDEISRKIDDENDKFNCKRDDIIIQAQLLIKQFESRLKPYWKSNQNKKKEERKFLNEYGKKFKKPDIKSVSAEIKRISDEVKKKISK